MSQFLAKSRIGSSVVSAVSMAVLLPTVLVAWSDAAAVAGKGAIVASVVGLGFCGGVGLVRFASLNSGLAGARDCLPPLIIRPTKNDFSPSAGIFRMTVSSSIGRWGRIGLVHVILLVPPYPTIGPPSTRLPNLNNNTTSINNDIGELIW